MESSVRPAVAIRIRPLFGSDFNNGFLEVLSALAEVNLSVNEAGEVLRERLRTGMQTFVALVGDKVVGTASLLLEKKFIHSGGYIGHIEDVAVHAEFQGHGIGKALIQRIQQEARKAGCYKVILNCKEHNVPFYQRLGFRRNEMEMRFDL